MRHVIIQLFLLTFLASASAAKAEEAPALEISGLGKARLTINDLENLPQTTITTGLPFFNGKATFVGLKLADLVGKFGAKAKEIKFSAIDDYTIVIPAADWQKYDVILAYKRDGQYMAPNQMGPLWVIYPQDQHPELKTKDVEARMIWQVTKADLR